MTLRVPTFAAGAEVALPCAVTGISSHTDALAGDPPEWRKGTFQSSLHTSNTEYVGDHRASRHFGEFSGIYHTELALIFPCQRGSSGEAAEALG